jgi:hypothetical protein
MPVNAVTMAALMTPPTPVLLADEARITSSSA